MPARHKPGRARFLGTFAVLDNHFMFMLPSRYILIALFATLLASAGVQSAHAAFGITNTYGSAIELCGPPSPDVLEGSNEAVGTNPALALIFPEVINGVVKGTPAHPQGLDVDHDGSTVVAVPTIHSEDISVNENLKPTTLDVGTSFNSYLLHFDPAGGPDFPVHAGIEIADKQYVTTITFDNPIIGVQLFSAGFNTLIKYVDGVPTPYTGTLEQGDIQVGLNVPGGMPPNYYPSNVPYRGIEEDAFVLAISGNTLMVALSVSSNEIDQIRVFTAPTIAAAVPEPTSVVTWVAIAITLGGIFTRCRQSSCY